jgi:hypothetical protein
MCHSCLPNQADCTLFKETGSYSPSAVSCLITVTRLLTSNSIRIFLSTNKHRLFLPINKPLSQFVSRNIRRCSHADHKQQLIDCLSCCLVFRMTGWCNVLVLLFGVFLLVTVEATITESNRVFTRCGLTRELFTFGMPKNQLNDCKYCNKLPNNT